MFSFQWFDTPRHRGIVKLSLDVVAAAAEGFESGTLRVNSANFAAPRVLRRSGKHASTIARIISPVFSLDAASNI